MADTHKELLDKLNRRNQEYKKYLERIEHGTDDIEAQEESLKLIFENIPEMVSELSDIIVENDPVKNSDSVALCASVYKLIEELLKDHRDYCYINNPRRNIISVGYSDDIANADYVVVV